MKRDYKDECFKITQNGTYPLFDMYQLRDKSEVDFTEMLFIASAQGMSDILQVVIDSGEDLNQIDYEGELNETALHLATINGNFDCVKLLVNAKANVNTFNKFGQTSLRQAIFNKRSDIALYLLSKGIEFSVPDFKDVTPLDLAKSNNLTDVVEAIEEYV
jgi:ankyrin repeat protein